MVGGRPPKLAASTCDILSRSVRGHERGMTYVGISLSETQRDRVSRSVTVGRTDGRSDGRRESGQLYSNGQASVAITKNGTPEISNLGPRFHRIAYFRIFCILFRLLIFGFSRVSKFAIFFGSTFFDRVDFFSRF